MEQFPAHDLTVPARHCGPPTSGNGGWTAGALAALIDHNCPEDRAKSWPTIEVTLRQPPPLDAPMTITTDGDLTTASFGGAEIASARVARDVDPADVPAVPVEEARAAMARYPGHTFHPFPTCYVCGTDRAEGDGQRIFPGQVEDADEMARAASVWVPQPSMAEDWHQYVDEHGRASLADTWAALDCVGGWAGDMTERLMVLGRMTAAVDTLPVLGEEHVVVGQKRGAEGRKTFTAGTLYDSDGRVVARAEHVWIAIDPDTFGT